MVVSKTSDYTQINMKMPNPIQETPLSSKAPNEDLNNMDVLCIFKIKIESQNLDHWYSKISDHTQIKIKMLSPSQEHPASSKAPNEDLKDMDVLCTFKIDIERQKSDYGCIME